MMSNSSPVNVGSYVTWRAVPPPWWRPIKRLLWYRRRRRQPFRADGTYQITLIYPNGDWDVVGPVSREKTEGAPF